MRLHLVSSPRKDRMCTSQESSVAYPTLRRPYHALEVVAVEPRNQADMKNTERSDERLQASVQ